MAELLRGKVSPLKQMWYKWRSSKNVPFRTKWFVGYDLEGNTFWEFQNYNDPQRMRRIVEYRDPNKSWVDYKIPPQWQMWLRHNRPTHPSLQELLADQQRQDKLKHLIREADQRWNSVPLKDAPNTTAQNGKVDGPAQTAEQFQPGAWDPSMKQGRDPQFRK